MNLWGKVDHPNIVKAFTLFDDCEVGEMYLMMQLADLGQIAEFNEQTKRFEVSPKIID